MLEAGVVAHQWKSDNKNEAIKSNLRRNLIRPGTTGGYQSTNIHTPAKVDPRVKESV